MATNETPKLVVEVDLGALWLDEKGSVAEFIADRAAARLLEGTAAATSEFMQRVRRIRDEEIRALITPMLADAVERSIQPTDGFGNPKGEPTTLRDVIVADAEKLLTEKRYEHGNRKRSLIEQVVFDEVEKALASELRDAVKVAKQEVLAAVQEKAGEIIAETIDRVRTGRL